MDWPDRRNISGGVKPNCGSHSGCAPESLVELLHMQVPGSAPRIKNQLWSRTKATAFLQAMENSHSFLGCKVVRKSVLKLVLLEYRMDWRKQICCFVKVFSNLFMCMCVHSNSLARLLSFLRSECICFGIPDTGLDSEDKQINKLQLLLSLTLQEANT